MSRPAAAPSGQLLPLLALRSRMVRSQRLRALLGAVLLIPLLLAVVGVLVIDEVPDDQAFNVAVITPTLYLAFALLAVLAPLAAGGGYDLYPAEQLVAYPIRPRTVFLAALVLSPVNLAWMLNVVALVVVTSFASGPVGWGTARAMVSLSAYVGLVTILGLAFTWLVVAVRATRTGRWATWAAAALALAATAVVVRLDLAFALLDASPTKYALFNALQGYHHSYRSWLVGLAVMAGMSLAAALAGVRATAWALRRPVDHARGDSRAPVRRRAARSTLHRELVALDRTSVWRAAPLRRGTLVLVLLPGAVAAVAGMNWQSMVLLPGLVAAGAGLLFGINSFCLDAGGATWLSTLPGWERHAFVAKARVVGEVSLGSVGAALLGASLRAPVPQSGAEVTATVGVALATTSLVIASSMRASVRHPFRADLRGPRDTPAPPGVMALHSLRLAVVTTFVGLLFSGFAYLDTWWLPLVLTVPFLCWAGLSLIDSSRAWADPVVRARVVTTVSGG